MYTVESLLNLAIKCSENRNNDNVTDTEILDKVRQL